MNNLTPAPGLPEPKTSVLLDIPATAIERAETAQSKIQYTLYYRVGTNPHPQFTFFLWPSADMRIVVERAKRFCDGMGYRFVNVQPSMTDLNSVEARRRESET